MAIRSQYYDLTKDMPSSFNFLILHYSSTKFVLVGNAFVMQSFVENIFSEVLYAALFNGKMGSGKGATPTGSNKQSTAKTPGL